MKVTVIGEIDAETAAQMLAALGGATSALIAPRDDLPTVDAEPLTPEEEAHG